MQTWLFGPAIVRKRRGAVRQGRFRGRYVFTSHEKTDFLISDYYCGICGGDFAGDAAFDAAGVREGGGRGVVCGCAVYGDVGCLRDGAGGA